MEHVDPAGALDDVVALAGVDVVVAGEVVDDVGAAIAHDQIGLSRAEEIVRLVVAADHEAAVRLLVAVAPEVVPEERGHGRVPDVLQADEMGQPEIGEVVADFGIGERFEGEDVARDRRCRRVGKAAEVVAQGIEDHLAERTRAAPEGLIQPVPLQEGVPDGRLSCGSGQDRGRIGRPGLRRQSELLKDQRVIVPDRGDGQFERRLSGRRQGLPLREILLHEPQGDLRPVDGFGGEGLGEGAGDRAAERVVVDHIEGEPAVGVPESAEVGVVADGVLRQNVGLELREFRGRQHAIRHLLRLPLPNCPSSSVVSRTCTLVIRA